MHESIVEWVTKGLIIWISGLLFSSWTQALLLVLDFGIWRMGLSAFQNCCKECMKERDGGIMWPHRKIICVETYLGSYEGSFFLPPPTLCKQDCEPSKAHIFLWRPFCPSFHFSFPPSIPPSIPPSFLSFLLSSYFHWTPNICQALGIQSNKSQTYFVLLRSSQWGSQI